MATLLSGLRQQLVQGQVTDHLRAFDAITDQEGVVMGCVQQTAPNVAEMPISARRRESGHELAATKDMSSKEVRTLVEGHLLARMDAIQKARSAREQKRMSSIAQNTKTAERHIYEHFQNVSRELSTRMKSRAIEVLHHYGPAVLQPPDVITLDPDRVHWDSLNQQVEIVIQSVRGLRGKVPDGQYVVLISKCSQLGGSTMAWSNRNVASSIPPPCTLHPDTSASHLPQRIRCEVCNGQVGCSASTTYTSKQSHSLVFDSTMHTFMPPQTTIKPYTVFLFELIRLPNAADEDKAQAKALGHDAWRSKTVGWGAFPAVNSHFNIIKGKFKIPLLRGCVREDIRHHSTLMSWLQNDIENWLGNLYIEVYPKPRVFFGRDEFELQTKVYNRLLRLDSNGKSLQEATDGTQDRSQPTSPKKAKQHWAGVRKAFLTPEAKDDLEGTKTSGILDLTGPAVASRSRRGSRTWLEHSANVNGLNEVHISAWAIQMEYCWRAVKDELSLREPMSFRFWFVIVLSVVTCYAQMFIHGIGVYTALQIAAVPIIGITPEYYGLLVTYRSFYTTAFQELFVAFLGQGLNVLATCVLVGSALLFKIATGSYPEQISKFVFTSGITMIFVPYLEIILTQGLGVPYDDLTRLLNFCAQNNYESFYGVVAFLVVFFNLTGLLLVVLFLYTMRIHMNGILQDTFWRINGAREDETLFLPQDFELGIQELVWVLERAERWRGPNGERRKVMVEELVTVDEHDKQYRKKELRIAVYEIEGKTQYRMWKTEVKQPPKLYREFFVLESGAILEAMHDEEEVSAAWAVDLWKKKVRKSFSA